MDPSNLLKSIIPPMTREFREQFSNHAFIDGLTREQRRQVELELIPLLEISPIDPLVVDTLIYLKSEESIPILYRLLDKLPEPYQKLHVAQRLHQMTGDPGLFRVATDALHQIGQETGPYRQYGLSSALHIISLFGLPECAIVIQQYLADPEKLVALKARSLVYGDDSIRPEKKRSSLFRDVFRYVFRIH